MKCSPAIFRPRTAARARSGAGAALLAAAACLGGCDDLGSNATVSSLHTTVPAAFVRHRSRGGEVKLMAPAGWREVNTSGVVALYLRTGQPRSSVNVTIVPAEAGETLDRTMAGVPEKLRHEFADFSLSKSEYVFLKETPAVRLVYEASRENFHARLMQVFILRNGRHYILTYTADPEVYATEVKAVEQVLASLEIAR